ncbi:MAG: chemotaxis protein CheX [Nannocystaceae bacterium]|nr:chemotaxis protein CheX [Nannocystaceae bacterium]
MLDVSSEDIASIVRMVFETVFAMPASDTEPGKLPTSVASSLIGIAGKWDGAVILDCSPGVARELATIMFGVPEAEVDRSHIEDTMGELANMIGGNLKALLAPPCTLSLPTVVEGHDYRVRVPGATVVRDLSFELPRGFLRVLVAERGSGRTTGVAA